MEHWITLDKSEGEGKASVKVSAGENAGTDKSAALIVKTTKNSVVRVKVIEPGLREEFHTTQGALICAGTGEFLTLKK